MHRSPAFLPLAAVFLAAAPVTSAAQDSLNATVDLGFVNTAGNTDVTTLNFGEKVGYLTAPWRFSQFVSVVYGQNGGVETADQWKTGVRADYRFVARFGAYGLVSFERNRFAGIGRRFEEAGGVAYQVVAAPRDALDIETGINFVQQGDLALVTNSFAAGRFATVFKHQLTTAAYVQESAEALLNLKTSDDIRVNSETALVAPISKRIALKASYVIRYDNVPEAGFQKTDRILTTGLQIVF